MAMIDWNLQTRAHRCQSCDKSFSDEEIYHTLLSDDRGAYARLDVCETCWAGQYSQGSTDRKGFISHWQGVFHAPAPQPEPIQQATAESLLRQLSEKGDPRYLPARYILAVILERKRRLKVKSEIQEEGRRVFIYEHSLTGDIFKIEDPQLQLDQLQEVQREVASLLHGEAQDRAVAGAPVQASSLPAESESTPAPPPATLEALTASGLPNVPVH